MKTKVKISMALLLCSLWLAPQAAQAREWKIYENPRFGYALRIPAEFTLQSEGETTTWVYQPPQRTPPPGHRGRDDDRINVNLGPINIQFDDPNKRGKGRGRDDDRYGHRPPPPPEPPITISVTWQWTPDRPTETLFRSVRATDEQEAKSPSPDITGITDFDLGAGYAYEGTTYWFRERDKPRPDDAHKWVLRSFGNWSTYTVEITGAAAQFGEWGPVFEETFRSWKLTPMDRRR